MIDGFEHAVKLLASDNEDERIRAVEWLSDTADPKAAEAVRQIAFDFAEDDFVRRAAVFYFEAILDSGSVSEMLQDPSWVVREEAVSALGRMGAEHAAPLLRMALNDRKRHVRRSADKALRALDADDRLQS